MTEQVLNHYQRENDFYRDNLAMLREKYPEKELVIVGDKIIGVYDDYGTAIEEAKKTHPLGTFCVKHVRMEPEMIRIPTYFEGYAL
jgi:hypothetical protein